MTDRQKNTIAYAALMVLQSLAVAYLLLVIFPIFYAVVTHLGERQQVPSSTFIAILITALVQQASYWARMRWVEVRAPFRSILVSHLFSFAARMAFLFGGVLFSTIFFRHLPEINALPHSVKRCCLARWSCWCCSGSFATPSNLSASLRPSRFRLKPDRVSYYLKDRHV